MDSEDALSIILPVLCAWHIGKAFLTHHHTVPHTGMCLPWGKTTLLMTGQSIPSHFPSHFSSRGLSLQCVRTRPSPLRAVHTCLPHTCAVSPPSGCASMRENISVIMMSSSRGVDSLAR